MNEALRQIYKACDPDTPATEEYYLDCSDARGSHDLTKKFRSHLSLRPETDYLSFLFAGHIGCGKSSELARLKRSLSNTSAPDSCYFPILLDASEYLDDYDADATDILLAIVTELAATLREELGIELKDSYFQKRLKEVQKFFLRDVEIDEGELSLWAAKATIQLMKTDPLAREQVREALLPRMSSMLNEINTVFDKARLEIRKKSNESGLPYKDIVLILDNLEKLERVSGKNQGLDSHRELFLERGTQLTQLNVHVIYTVPLQLSRWDGNQLKMRYGTAPFVLPMIKVIDRSLQRQPYRPGISRLKELLQKRMGGLALEDAFTAEALDFLVTYSGGHVRDMMIFVREACTYGEFPIPIEAMYQAAQETVRLFSTSIPEGHWQKLALLDRSKDRKIPNDDEDYLQMLRNLSVLEYLNGGGGNFIVGAEPWYAVHPIVRELEKFKEAEAGLDDEEELAG